MIKADQNNGWVFLAFDDVDMASSFFSFLSDMMDKKDIQRSRNLVLLPYLLYLRHEKDIEDFAECFHQELVRSKRLLRLKPCPYGREDSSLLSMDVQSVLYQKGFQRELTSFQVRNLKKILPLSSAALFSVPGSGKTSEALAYYLFHRKKGDRLLVVCPKNAFSSWKEQLHFCFTKGEADFVRIDGDYFLDAAPRLLPDKMIISYQQLLLLREEIMQEMKNDRFFLFVDESHRIKNPEAKTTECLLSLSFLAQRKLILSGTPMPQSSVDLIPQFSFLFPSRHVTSQDVIPSFQPYYTRTTEAELKIPPIHEIQMEVSLGEEEKKLYKLCSSKIVRQSEEGLSAYDKSAMAKINQCILLLLELLSMPSSVLPYFGSSMTPTIQKSLGHMKGSKYMEAIRLVKRLMKEEGKKVIIWSSFVKTIRNLDMDLKEYGSDCIYGETESGNVFDEDSREGKLEAFRKDPEKRVLIMNPQACGESISLQMCCQTMIYVDRTFNAANYIQSLDRIHRIGIKESPVVYILNAKDTIDDYLSAKLKLKIERMYLALNDSSLKESMFSYNGPSSDTNFNSEELLSVVEYLKNN